MPSTDVQKLAERIAKLLESESGNSDLAALFASIEKINHRLDKLEKGAMNLQSDVRGPNSNHPSLQKFHVIEAVGDTKEKTCTFEPNGRPCDHCSMCNSRGF